MGDCDKGESESLPDDMGEGRKQGTQYALGLQNALCNALCDRSAVKLKISHAGL